MVRTAAGSFALSFVATGLAWAQAAAPVSTIQYDCAQGKSLMAEYFTGVARTAPDGAPIPGGYVVLTLADGQKLRLPQTLSGSGVRYANAGESLVFWSKGQTAFLEEGSARTVAYADCIARK